MHPPDVLHRIADEYGLSRVRSVRRLPTSRMNVASCIDSAEGTFVVRSLRRRDYLDDLPGQHAFLARLERAGYPARAPLPTRGGETICWIGRGAYDVYPYVPGCRLRYGSAAQLNGAGRALAEFHRLSLGTATLNDAGTDFRDQFLDTAERFASIASGLRDVARAHRVNALVQATAVAVHDLVERMADLDYQALPVVTIHGDYQRGNLVFRGDRLVAVLDFDSSRPDARAFEVAAAVAKLARLPGRSGDLDPHSVAVLVRAYDDEFPLGPEEADAVPLLLEARAVAAAADRAVRLAQATVEDRTKRAERFRKYARRMRTLRDGAHGWRVALEHSLASNTSRR